MSSATKRPLETLRRPDEFLRRAKHDPKKPKIDHSHGGSHVKISTERGFVIIPDHPGEIHRGLLCAIRKEWLAIGLTILGIGVYLVSEFAGV